MSGVATAKRLVIAAGRGVGAMSLVQRSDWRRRRLLILCYHGVAIDDEHQWNPRLYMRPSFLERRLQLLRDGGYTIIGLDEGLRRLGDGTLPGPSVALTFDDGAYDFHARAFPVLQAYGAPATVYQTTFYADDKRPVFDVFASYLLWKGRHTRADLSALIPGAGARDLGDTVERQALHQALLAHVGRDAYTADDKDALLHQLAAALGVEIEPLLARRILHILNADEVRELSQRGIDFQLHTHRHRTPRDAASFTREIDDNRRWLHAATGHSPRHFCYPSGVYRREMLPWLRAAGVTSATTCDPGIATPSSEPLLLPRYVDSELLSELDFLSWTSGMAELLPRRTRLGRGAEAEG